MAKFLTPVLDTAIIFFSCQHLNKRAVQGNVEELLLNFIQQYYM